VKITNETITQLGKISPQMILGMKPKLFWKWTILESENADLKKNCEKSENERKLERDELLEKIEFLKNENLILKSENEKLEKTIREGNFTKMNVTTVPIIVFGMVVFVICCYNYIDLEEMKKITSSDEL